MCTHRCHMPDGFFKVLCIFLHPLPGTLSLSQCWWTASRVPEHPPRGFWFTVHLPYLHGDPTKVLVYQWGLQRCQLLCRLLDCHRVYCKEMPKSVYCDHVQYPNHPNPSRALPCTTPSLRRLVKITGLPRKYTHTCPSHKPWNAWYLNQDFLKILNTGAIDRQDLVQCTTSATARCDVSWKVPNKTSSLTSLVP